MSTTERTLSVPSMTCGHCRASVEAALRAVGGVAAVEVDLSTKLVTVRLDPDPGLEVLVAAVEAAGHEVRGR